MGLKGHTKTVRTPYWVIFIGVDSVDIAKIENMKNQTPKMAIESVLAPGLGWYKQITCENSWIDF